jgi:hypothetical protein
MHVPRLGSGERRRDHTGGREMSPDDESGPWLDRPSQSGRRRGNRRANGWRHHDQCRQPGRWGTTPVRSDTACRWCTGASYGRGHDPCPCLAIGRPKFGEGWALLAGRARGSRPGARTWPVVGPVRRVSDIHGRPHLRVTLCPPRARSKGARHGEQRGTTGTTPLPPAGQRPPRPTQRRIRRLPN